MASVITRSLHPDLLWPGVQKTFGLEYDQFNKIYPEIFDVETGKYATERAVETTGFGLPTQKAESAAISYDTDGEGYVNTATYFVLGMGYMVTREEIEDNLYADVAARRTSAITHSMNVGVEITHANVFLNAFSGSYTYGDGASLVSASHATRAGNQSNTGTVAADLSEASVEDIFTKIYLAQNSRGLPINLLPKALLVSAADRFNATRIMGSQLRPGTANNDINAIKALNMLPEGIIVNPYFGNQTTQAWFVLTKLPSGAGLKSMWRRKMEIEKDNDFDTENAKVKITARFTPMVADWRSVYGNPGV